MSRKKCSNSDCESCECAESEYGKTIYPRATPQSIVKGFTVGTEVRNPSAHTEGIVVGVRYKDVRVRVTKHSVKKMGSNELEERPADFEVIYDPKFLEVIEEGV